MLLEGRTENAYGVLARDTGRIPNDGPCDLFRRIQKRDGRIVDFVPKKITEAIFKAAQSVGGKDYRRAETLTEYVILALAQRFQGSTNLLNIEQVQDSIERVLVEKGHYRTARAFITYRNERAKRRALRGELYLPCELYDGTGTLQSASVATSNGDTIRWDREKIVKALVRETSLPYEEARKVSHAVEMEIVHSKITHLTSTLIRELTNAKLLQLGFENERRLHARLGLPVYDVEQRLLGKDVSRGCRTVEDEILRQFALDKVLPLAVSEAHGIQDIHVHDLELIHKPIEFRRELDLKQTLAWYHPTQDSQQEAMSSWTGFLATWEREEHRLLKVVGKRLIWDNLNTSIAFHAQTSGMTIPSAVSQSLEKLWRHAGAMEDSPRIVWRMTDKVRPHWRGKFIGARQMVLLPEDEIETANRSVLLEILRQLEEVGPYWMACGAEFEVVIDARSGVSLDSNLLDALASCIQASVPLRILFHRPTVVANPSETDTAPLVQTLSLNVARAAATAEGNESALAEWLEDRLNLVAQAHAAKKGILAERLKAGALAPLQAPGGSEKDHLFSLDQAFFGVGLWGLSEMTRLTLGKTPAEDEEALKWLIKLLARLKLRMEEIGKRNGLNLQFVACVDSDVIERLSHSLDRAGFLYEGQSHESLLGIQGDETTVWTAEGKLHPFFAFGHCLAAIEGLNRMERGRIVKAIHALAESTHVLGITWAGECFHCKECGAVFGETRSVCDVCGGGMLVRVSRDGQGMSNQISRL